MNYKQLSYALASVLLLCSCGSNQNCKNDTSLTESFETTTSKDNTTSEEHNDVYDIYIEYRSSGGKMTYDEWLNTIKNGNSFSKLITGNGAPSTDIGFDGDSYIDLITWNYYVKENNNWVLKGCLKGGDGTDGLDGTDGDTYIPCKFNNNDGRLLYETYVKKGDNAVFVGSTPTFTSIATKGFDYSYTFNGWDRDLENIQKPTTFTAMYNAPVYSVRFYNSDGTLIKTINVEKGHDAIFDDEYPTKPNDTSGIWVFAGWSGNCKNITGDTNVYAQYMCATAVKCTFVNLDGEVLSVQYCGQGDTIVYKGSTPQMGTTYINHVVTEYTFNGWDKQLSNIQEDTIITATYTTNTYNATKVTYLDNNGSVIQWKYVKEGESKGYTPWARRGLNYVNDGLFKYDDTYCYIFTNWMSETETDGDTTYTANYKVVDRDKAGKYPRRLVTDDQSKNALSEITTINEYGYIEYNGKEYKKVVNNRTDSFVNAYEYKVFQDAGSTIKPNDVAYFEVLPIRWTCLEYSDSVCKAISLDIIDSISLSPCAPYIDSNLRNYLNNDFLIKAFGANYSDSLIKNYIDNSKTSTGSKNVNTEYLCSPTNDYVYLLSISDYENPSYNFDEGIKIDLNANSECINSLISEPTTYSKIVSTNYSTDLFDSYWTRTPESGTTYYAYQYSAGMMRLSGAGASRGLRPAVTFK